MTLPYRSVVFFGLLSSSCLANGQSLTHFTGGDTSSVEDFQGVRSESFTDAMARVKLPDTVDLSRWFPPAGDQREQASCSGWAL
ncbi:MAG TPA: hypothetical protein PK760_02170, partial [Flavobacteriales bacterium]|nr:hypothetical protein [Flavobacteriales bacterium]